MKVLVTVFTLLSFAAASVAISPAGAASRSATGGAAVAKAANDNTVVEVAKKKVGKKRGKSGKKGRKGRGARH